jgi:hypothetical protein
MYLKLLTYFYFSYLAMAFDSSPEHRVLAIVLPWLATVFVDPHHIDADPDPTFHLDADPDPDLSLKKELKPSNQNAKIGLYSIPLFGLTSAN